MADVCVNAHVCVSRMCIQRIKQGIHSAIVNSNLNLKWIMNFHDFSPKFSFNILAFKFNYRTNFIVSSRVCVSGNSPRHETMTQRAFWFKHWPCMCVCLSVSSAFVSLTSFQHHLSSVEIFRWSCIQQKQRKKETKIGKKDKFLCWRNGKAIYFLIRYKTQRIRFIDIVICDWPRQQQ